MTEFASCSTSFILWPWKEAKTAVRHSFSQLCYLQQWDICPFLKGFLFTFFLFILPIFLHFDNGTNYTDNTVMYTVKFFFPFLYLVQNPNSRTKSRQVLGVFLLAIHSHLHSFALRFIVLETHTTSYSFYSSVHCEGEWRTLKIMSRNLNEMLRFFSGRFAISYCTNECLLLFALVYICFRWSKYWVHFPPVKMFLYCIKKGMPGPKKFPYFVSCAQIAQMAQKIPCIPNHCIVESPQKALQRENANRQIVIYWQ